MKEGLLWFDNNPRKSVADKVGQAAARYQVKFRCRPTTCFLNTADYEGQPEALDGIRLRAVANIQRNHFWIGVDYDASRAA